jgi:hypothetical protein
LELVRASARRRVATTKAAPTHSNTSATATLGKELDEPVRGRDDPEAAAVTVTVAVSTTLSPWGPAHVAVTSTLPDALLGIVTAPEKAPLESAVAEPAEAPATAKSTVALEAHPSPEIVSVPPAETVLESTPRVPPLGGYSWAPAADGSRMRVSRVPMSTNVTLRNTTRPSHYPVPPASFETRTSLS